VLKEAVRLDQSERRLLDGVIGSRLQMFRLSDGSHLSCLSVAAAHRAR